MKFTDLEQEILNNEKVIVYGAGYYGHTVVDYLLQSDFCTEQMVFVAVTKMNDTKEVHHIPVREIGAMIEFTNVLVIVAVSKEKQEDILKNLQKKGFSKIFLMNETLLRYMQRTVSKKDVQNKKFIKAIDDVAGTKRFVMDIVNEINFDRAISESSWLEKKNFSSGGMAVNGKYLYHMYKILDSGKFHSILDIGMGQTTKMISQYVNYDSEARHIIIENDEDWIKFFGEQLEIGEGTSIMQMNYAMREFNGTQVRTYADFKEKLSGYKFDYISIDAPLGKGMDIYSRIDILSIFPECLSKSWIIMFDDVNRSGEKNTLKLIRERLEKEKIKYAEKIYNGGEKSFATLTSYDNRFFCTV